MAFSSTLAERGTLLALIWFGIAFVVMFVIAMARNIHLPRLTRKTPPANPENEDNQVNIKKIVRDFEDELEELRHREQLQLDQDCEDAREAGLHADVLRERIKGLVLSAYRRLATQEETLRRTYMAKQGFADGRPSLARQLIGMREELLSVAKIRAEIDRQMEDS